MSYPAFENMPLWTKVRATKNITGKNRTMRTGETGVIVVRYAYTVGIRPDGRSLTIETGDTTALELV